MNRIKISKYLSMILRHRPQAAGIELDAHGWADIDELLAGMQKRYPLFDREMLEQIVARDEKQRYAFDETHARIRANQGHSIQVDVELQEKYRRMYCGMAVPDVLIMQSVGKDSNRCPGCMCICPKISKQL